MSIGRRMIDLKIKENDIRVVNMYSNYYLIG